VAGACSTHGRDRKCVEKFVEKRKGKIPLERPRQDWENNIKVGLTDIEW
jgi:hypothetical protein